MDEPVEAPGDPAATPVLLWSLREDTLVETDDEHDALVVVTRWGEIRIDRPGPAVRESLRRMSFGPVSLTNVLSNDNVLSHEPAGPDGGGGPAAVRAGCAELAEVLARLQGAVVESVGLENRNGLLLSVVPISGQATLRLPEFDPAQPCRLSRFATLSTRDGEGVLESPLALHRVVLHQREAVWAAASLARPSTVGDLARALSLPEPVAHALVAHLAAAGMVVGGERRPAPEPPHFAEDADPALLAWAEHDLLFHTRSRLGRHDGPYGAAYPQGGRPPREPAVKAPPSGVRFALYRPSEEDLLATDPPLTAVLEAQRPGSCFGEDRLTADQLGELLHRAARIRSMGLRGHDHGPPYTVSDRPYPSTGGLYELELYVVTGDCVGLPRGIHHYDPLGHSLTLINKDEADISELLGAAQIAARMHRPPPVLITITARFGRLSWVYSGMAYATTLKNVGVLQQTLSLVSTAMRLAPHPVAFGDSEAAARALGLDWRVESSVGEFVVGPWPSVN